MPSNFFTTTVNDSGEGNSCPAVNPESECFSLCSMTHQPSNRHVKGHIVLLGTRDRTHCPAGDQGPWGVVAKLAYSQICVMVNGGLARWHPDRYRMDGT